MDSERSLVPSVPSVLKTADFNNFASHVKIAAHAFFVIMLAEAVQFLMK